MKDKINREYDASTGEVACEFRSGTSSTLKLTFQFNLANTKQPSKLKKNQTKTKQTTKPPYTSAQVSCLMLLTMQVLLTLKPAQDGAEGVTENSFKTSVLHTSLSIPTYITCTTTALSQTRELNLQIHIQQDQCFVKLGSLNQQTKITGTPGLLHQNMQQPLVFQVGRYESRTCCNRQPDLPEVDRALQASHNVSFIWLFRLFRDRARRLFSQ